MVGRRCDIQCVTRLFAITSYATQTEDRTPNDEDEDGLAHPRPLLRFDVCRVAGWVQGFYEPFTANFYYDSIILYLGCEGMQGLALRNV